MNTERENGMILLTAAAWVVVMVLTLLFCSCGARKSVTVTEYVHDTLRIAHSDTARVERWNWRHDTIRVESERIVTLLQPSDRTLPAETIRVETNNWHWQKEVVRDSSSKVVARVDSILRALDQQRKEETVKVKPTIPMWQYCVFAAIVCGFCVIVLKSRIF